MNSQWCFLLGFLIKTKVSHWDLLSPLNCFSAIWLPWKLTTILYWHYGNWPSWSLCSYYYCLSCFKPREQWQGYCKSSLVLRQLTWAIWWYRSFINKFSHEKAKKECEELSRENQHLQQKMDQIANQLSVAELSVAELSVANKVSIARDKSKDESFCSKYKAVHVAKHGPLLAFGSWLPVCEKFRACVQFESMH